jgi:hypothetical protein
MEWLNLHTSTLDAPEFVGAEPHERSAWLCLLRFCIGQENGGVIKGCRDWNDRRWQQMCRVTQEEVSADSDLWKWKGNNLVVWAYPLTKENEIRSKREAGKATAAKRWAKADSSAHSSATSSPDSTPTPQPYAEGEGNRKGKEEEGNRKGNAKGGTDVSPLDPRPAKQGLTARPSSFAQVDAYFAESLDAPKTEAEAFFDHFTANGWKVGRTAMKDWRAAARNWVRRSASGSRGGSRVTDGRAFANKKLATGGDDARDWVPIDWEKREALERELAAMPGVGAQFAPRDDAHLTADEAWALQQERARAAELAGATQGGGR